MSDAESPPERSYGCSMACGNPYDFVLLSVQDAETLFLCLPCLIAQCAEMLKAVADPDDPEVQRRMAEAGTVEAAPMKGGVKRSRGHHAPAVSDDPDLLAAFDGVVHEDELPEAFR